MRDILFDAKDAQAAEQKYGLLYFVSSDRRTLIPATHVGGDRIGLISVHPGAMGDVVNWRVVDPNGNILIWSSERIGRRFSLLRRALRALHNQGCDVRVRPGDRGPWGPGADHGDDERRAAQGS